MINDYLSAEELIIGRLEEKLTLVAQQDINPVADAGAETLKKQTRPKFIMVQFWGDQVVTHVNGKALNGRAQLVDQLWLVVVAAKHVGDSSGKKARNLAGPIAIEVLHALQGYSLSDFHSRLKRRNSPYRATYRDGYCYLPFMFETRVSVTAPLE